MSEKTSDAVAYMRCRRAEIDEEDRDLTWQQRGEKTLKLLENNPRRRRLKKRLARTNRIDKLTRR